MKTQATMAMVENFPVTLHTGDLEDALVKLGFLERVSDDELLSARFERVQSLLKRSKVLDRIPHSDLQDIRRGIRNADAVLERLKLAETVVRTACRRIHKRSRSSLARALNELGIESEIAAEDIRAIEDGADLGAIVAAKRLGGRVLRALIARTEPGDSRKARTAPPRDEWNPHLFRYDGFSMEGYWRLPEAEWGVVNTTEVVHLMSFGKRMESNAVIEHCKGSNRKVASFKYMLALVAEHPYLLTPTPDGPMDYGRPIVALGAIHGSVVPVFSMGSRGVTLSEGSAHTNAWPEKTRFVAITHRR